MYYRPSSCGLVSSSSRGMNVPTLPSSSSTSRFSPAPVVPMQSNATSTLADGSDMEVSMCFGLPYVGHMYNDRVVLTPPSTSRAEFAPSVGSLSPSHLASSTNVDFLIRKLQDLGLWLPMPQPADSEPMLNHTVSKIMFQVVVDGIYDQAIKFFGILFEKIPEDLFVPWLAQHMVVNEVAKKSSIHSVIYNMMLMLRRDSLILKVEDETFRCIDLVFELSKKVEVKSEARHALKNLGHFLGWLTIARNRPIVAPRLNLDRMLLDAMNDGTDSIHLVVPFVAKILSSCKYSTILTIHCTWIRSLLFRLLDVYKSSGCLESHRREICDLFSSLQLTVEAVEAERKNTSEPIVARYDVRQRNILEIRPTKRSSHSSGATNGGDEEHSANVPEMILLDDPDNSLNSCDVNDEEGDECRPTSSRSDSSSSGSRNESFGNNDFELENVTEFVPATYEDPRLPHITYNNLDISSLDGLRCHVYVDPLLELFGGVSDELRSLIECALKYAVSQTLGFVATKAALEALYISEEMILKDFSLARNVDKEQVHECIRSMVKSMAGGLAYGMATGPVSNLIEGFLQQNWIQNPRISFMSMKGAPKVREGNAKVAACFIAKTACEQALTELENRINSGYFADVLHSLPVDREEPIPEFPGNRLNVYKTFSDMNIGFDD